MIGTMLVLFFATLIRSRPDRWENSTAYTRPSCVKMNIVKSNFYISTVTSKHLIQPLHCTLELQTGIRKQVIYWLQWNLAGYCVQEIITSIRS